MKAPSFPAKATWLNTEAPLSLKELKGQVVLLDFWTYCCVNCMHMHPVLARVEREFEGAPFQIIGVHSGKFDREGDAENIQKAIFRHGIEHPVLVDCDHDLWSQYGVRAWPTLVLIDGAGNIREEWAGEVRFENLANRIREILDEGYSKEILTTSLHRVYGKRSLAPSYFRFPGKVRCFPGTHDALGERLIVADTGHHQLVCLDIVRDAAGWPRVTGETRIGSGNVGQEDGSFQAASFRRPQGMDLQGNLLFVCDTENCLIRTVDFDAGRVATAAGTGASIGSGPSKDPWSATLRSPWDCAFLGKYLVIAMAGSHQLWILDYVADQLFVAVGSGAENHVDGAFAEAALAQPSSVFPIGNGVIFADSEVSSVRIADFETGTVGTLVGKGLFDYGDVDGPLEQVRLQHPLGAVIHEGNVFIADTFNNKIKRLDVARGTCETFIGSGGNEVLDEPGGLDVLGDFLYIPDTNNHRILIVHIPTREMRALEI